MKNAIVKFLRDEEGATAIEYGLIAGLVSIAIVATLNLLTGGITGLFTRITTALTNAAPTVGG